MQPPAPPPYGTPVALAPKLGLATAALVCGLVGLATFWLLGIVSALGLIFGLISAKSIKSGGGTLAGLGKARAGWITGLIGVIGAGVFFWAIATDRIATESDTDDDALTSYSQAEAGDCVVTVPDPDLALELDFVSCDVPHGFEVYLAGELNPDRTRDYPGESVVVAEVREACDDAFEPYVGLAYEASVYGTYYLVPPALGWGDDKGRYLCFLGGLDTTTVGSAFHSGQ